MQKDLYLSRNWLKCVCDFMSDCVADLQRGTSDPVLPSMPQEP